MLNKFHSSDKKSPCELSEVDGNIFALIAATSRCMKKDGRSSEVKRMQERVTSASSYEEAISRIFEFVEFER